eukprot:c17874_g1_i1.p1 GENE.c17874_g1_i1~~c17874_g1_i1.p1  ORF type:complete len:1266 (+),score=315.83 c17874_g1_i1:61-3798(+)
MSNPSEAPSKTALRQGKIALQEGCSDLKRERQRFIPPVPNVLKNLGRRAMVEKEAPTLVSGEEKDLMQGIFPHTFAKPRVELVEIEADSDSNVTRPLRVAVVLSGGQAPGGHNVIAGLYDGLKELNPESSLFGFLDGPKGIYTGKYAEIDRQVIEAYRNTGGFDMLCSGRDKIETPEQFENCLAVSAALALDALVIVGGDDSNTNAAVLAEYFISKCCSTRVCGCPKTIDGDLKNEFIPISFGFDTACRVFSDQIGNICFDTLSSQKYWQFVRLMGRSASSITLECALQTRPNMCLIGEEVEQSKKGLAEVCRDIADLVEQRAKRGKHYGVVLLPEGLIEFIPEFMALIKEINDVLEQVEPSEENVQNSLSVGNAALFAYLPSDIRHQLILDRDPHGNVQVSLIETEKLLGSVVAQELRKRKFTGKFDPQYSFCGYEGRSAFPSTFDTTYTYALGKCAAALVAHNQTGLITSVTNLDKAVSEWCCGGVPISAMCGMEKRKGKMKPVIKKALVELSGPRSAPFQALKARRSAWALADAYRSAGPMQFDSDAKMCRTLRYELVGITDDDTEGPELLARLLASEQCMGNFIFTPPMEEAMSGLAIERANAVVGVPAVLGAGAGVISGEQSQCLRYRDTNLIRSLLPTTSEQPLVELVQARGQDTFKANADTAPVRVGIVFNGRQAPGAHNVVCGLLDAITAINTENKLFAFLMGTEGFFRGQSIEITHEWVRLFRNQGGMHMLGRSVDQIRSPAQLDAAAKVCQEKQLTGLVLVGASKTHTDAAYLAEHFAQRKVGTSVVACPVGIGGDLMRGTFVQSSLGFDTHCHVSAEVIGNTATDGASNKKYYYFIRLNSGGHSPSHVALEVALQTQPTITLITEEIAESNKSLRAIASEIADVVVARSKIGKNYGIVLLPEGLLSCIPEVKALMSELDAIAAMAERAKQQQVSQGIKTATQSSSNMVDAAGGPSLTAALSRDGDLDVHGVAPFLTPWSRSLLTSLPKFAQAQLLLHRQSDGHTDLSKVDTERLLAHYVEEELKARKDRGEYKDKFACITSIKSSQARSSMPTQFDCELGYALGQSAGVLSAHRCNGYMVSITGLHHPVDEWRVAGAPLSCLLTADGVEFFPDGSSTRPRIAPAIVSFSSPDYLQYIALKKKWELQDCFQNPGPVQFSGATVNSRAVTISASRNDYLRDLDQLWALIEQVKVGCRPGCERDMMRVAMKGLDALAEMMQMARREQDAMFDSFKPV